MTIGVNKKSSIVYFKHETNPGESVVPSADDDGYFAVEEGFSSNYEREDLQSELITNSIGQKKGQVGLVTAGGEVPIEFKHSKVEGQKPEFGEMLETLLGTETIEAIEYTTAAAGSTVDELQMEAGEAASMNVGQAILLKDTTNNYHISPIKAVDTGTDKVTLAIPMPILEQNTALGKAVWYKPANDGHKHGTFGIYWGDEIIEQVKGSLVESFALEIQTGQIIKGSFTLSALNRSADDGSAAHTPAYDASNGLVGLDVEVYIDTTKIDFPSLTLNIANEIAELLSAKEVSGKVSSRVSSRSVDISLTEYLDDTVLGNQTKFEALTDFSFTIVAGRKDANGDWVPGECFCIYLPKCYFTQAPFADEDSIITEDLGIRAHIEDGDEVFINFL